MIGGTKMMRNVSTEPSTSVAFLRHTQIKFKESCVPECIDRDQVGGLGQVLGKKLELHPKIVSYNGTISDVVL